MTDAILFIAAAFVAFLIIVGLRHRGASDDIVDLARRDAERARDDAANEVAEARCAASARIENATRNDDLGDYIRDRTRR